jgi:DNA-binding NarL/FixJ family response regulator
VGDAALLFSAEEETSERVPLTERESEVLSYLAKGLANKQIAAALGISEHTIKFHVSSIYAKLNVTNRTEAVRAGLRAGWIAL